MNSEVNNQEKKRKVGRPKNTIRTPRRKYENRKNNDLSKEKRKSSMCLKWFVTISNVDISTSNPRKYLLELFPKKSVNLYLVSLEKNSEGSTSIYHLHAVLEFKNNYGLSFNKLSELIGHFYPRPKYRFNLEEVRDIEKSWVYVSKSDKDLLTNVSCSKLSPWYQLVEYCRTQPRINYTDPIIFNSKHPVNYLQQFHTEIRGQLSTWKGYERMEIEEFCTTCPWVKELIDTYNANIESSDKKPRHIYLYGDANAGKTSIVESIIGDNLNNRTLIVNEYTTHFFLQNYTQSAHHYFLLDEFQYEHCLKANINILKNFLERNSQFAISKKFQKSEVVSVHGPVFFISNYPLPESADEAFKVRLKVIHATCPYYACEIHTLSPAMQEKKKEIKKKRDDDGKKTRQMYLDTHTSTENIENLPDLSKDDEEFIKNFFSSVGGTNQVDSDLAVQGLEEEIVDLVVQGEEQEIAQEN